MTALAPEPESTDIAAMDDGDITKRIALLIRMSKTCGRQIGELQARMVEMDRERVSLTREQIRRLEAKLPKAEKSTTGVSDD